MNAQQLAELIAATHAQIAYDTHGDFYRETERRQREQAKQLEANKLQDQRKGKAK